jgi:hypothetical protein
MVDHGILRKTWREQDTQKIAILLLTIAVGVSEDERRWCLAHRVAL